MRRRTVVLLVITLLLLLAVGGAYAGIGMHYRTHFFPYSTVNGTDVSDMTADEAEALIASQVEDYRISARTREGLTEVIEGADIGYRYVSDGELQGFVERQNPLAWLTAYLGGGVAWEMETSAVCDESLVRQAVGRLSCMQEDRVTKPQDAHLEQKDGKYVIVPEVEGNQPDEERVYEAVLAAAAAGERAVDLEELDCYLAPKVRETDGALRAEAAVMNRYTTLQVTYQLGGGVTETLDAATIASWFSLDEQKQPVFDREKVAEWVNGLADRYDTIGTWPPFVTSHGETVWVEARTYGWQIDRESETEELYQKLLRGESGEREPVWYETAGRRGENDLGDTYVEIDYTNQRMWYYKDGALLAETAVVTGNTSQGMGSPEGIFCLVDKQRDAVLTGEDYKTPVSYWMPFYGGVGIHDADSWRSSYGGTIYQYGGSHGCINTPTAQAAVIYENIEIGTPIICYSSGVDYGYGETGSAGAAETEPETPEEIDLSQGMTDGTNGGDPSQETAPGTDTSGTPGYQDGDIVILDGSGQWTDGSVQPSPDGGVSGDDVVVMPDNRGQGQQ